tara:strand:+ start:92 stop:361 length:270 start_codon:yes stop_codon:yes gene_type:complete
MKVKPKENYKLLGTSIVLNKNKTYNAVIATNQPNYKEKGLIFVDDVLLNANEYIVKCDCCNSSFDILIEGDHLCGDCYNYIYNGSCKGV